MKYVSFQHNDGQSDVQSYGLVVDGGVVDLGKRMGEDCADLKALLVNGGIEAAKQYAGESADYSLDDITFLPVISNPGKIICVGLNYETHRKETGRPVAEHPAIFIRFADTQIGHNQAILKPKVSDALDYEGELAVVIGKGGRYISEEDALEHVAGYSCYNDATVRDWQRHTHQFTPGKNFPGSGAFGPYLVTPESVENFQEAQIKTLLNGDVMQEARLGDMIFPIPALINYISGFTELSTGDVICTGTPGGVGFKRDPQVFMKAEDKIEVLIDGVGRLENTVANEQ